MDIVGIERESFDLEKIVSWTKNQSSLKKFYIEQEWIKGISGLLKFNSSIFTNTSGKWKVVFL